MAPCCLDNNLDESQVGCIIRSSFYWCLLGFDRHLVCIMGGEIPSVKQPKGIGQELACKRELFSLILLCSANGLNKPVA